MTVRMEAAGSEVVEQQARAGGLMHIGEVAERVRLSHRTVRHYDEEGLLTPARSPGNFRLFTEADVQRLLLIRQMKPLGFSLEDMRRLIGVLDIVSAGTPDQVHRAELAQFLAEARRRREELAEKLRSADLWIADLESLAEA